MTVELLGPDGKTLIATTTTDISGSYVFTNVPFSEDAYRAQVVSPYPGMNACTTKDKTDATKTNELQLDTVDPATPNVTNTDVGYYVPPETISIPVQKLWNDVDDTSARPGEIVVRLLKNDKPTLESLTLNAGNGWRGSFDNLLKLIFVARAPMIGDEKSDVPYIRILPMSAAIATLAPNTACT